MCLSPFAFGVIVATVAAIAVIVTVVAVVLVAPATIAFLHLLILQNMSTCVPSCLHKESACFTVHGCG